VTTASMAAAVLSAVLFLGYGSLVLFSGGMRAEFERFGLSRFRQLTGALEVVGGLGLLVGLARPTVMVVASGGLALLMLLGVIVRVRVRDPLLETAPAAVLMLVNAYVLVEATSVVLGA
jgi:uncharacterized membrane protein YphA (DoxX/SURF4 family)